jgi:Tol biopolymer transport system component
VDGEYPAWSPDGIELAYDRQTFSVNDFDVWVMSADGSGGRELVGGPGDDHGPAWSPDGNRLVFHSERGSDTGLPGIWTIRPDGSQLSRIADDGYGPDWSPDGRYVVFMSEGGLTIVRADGSGRTKVPIEGVGAEPTFPDWSC